MQIGFLVVKGIRMENLEKQSRKEETTEDILKSLDKCYGLTFQKGTRRICGIYQAQKGKQDKYRKS